MRIGRGGCLSQLGRPPPSAAAAWVYRPRLLPNYSPKCIASSEDWVLFEHLFHPADLFIEGFGLALLKFSEVYHLPLDAGQFRGMGAMQQPPIGIGAKQAQKKIFMVAGEPLHQFGSKAGTGFYQLLQGHGNRCHPGELFLSGAGDPEPPRACHRIIPLRKEREQPTPP